MKTLNIDEQRQVVGGKFKALVYCPGYAAFECHRDYSSSSYDFCYGSGTIEYWTAVDYAIEWYGCYYGPAMACYAHDANINAGMEIW